MNKRAVRDSIRLFKAILFSVLYIPHIIMLLTLKNNSKVFHICASSTEKGKSYDDALGMCLIFSDIKNLKTQINIKLGNWLALLYLLHNNSYYRSLFYHRLGPVRSMLISWYRPGNKYFTIGNTVKIGKGFWFAHPYATIIAADSIGDNFRCIHCTTLGNTSKGRPTIGNNVSLGANVTIVGPVYIGNNVIIGAGSVVVKDIPDNSVAVGNPAKVIKRLDDILVDNI